MQMQYPTARFALAFSVDPKAAPVISVGAIPLGFLQPMILHNKGRPPHDLPPFRLVAMTPKILPLLLLLIAALITACQTSQPTPQTSETWTVPLTPFPTPGKNAVVFIEHHTQTVVNCITGDCQGQFHDYNMCIDGPAYGWDEQQRTLTINKGWSNYQFPEGIQAIYGWGEDLATSYACGGVGTVLNSVDEMPFEAESGIQIQQIDVDGAVHIDVHGEQITLLPGQKWLKSSQETLQQGWAKLQVTRTEWFMNSGYLDPVNVIGPRK